MRRCSVLTVVIVHRTFKSAVVASGAIGELMKPSGCWFLFQDLGELVVLVRHWLVLPERVSMACCVYRELLDLESFLC